MQSSARRWFTQEAEHAGWISAIACVVGACWCLGSGMTRSSWFAILYPILPIALGCVAVGALNFRRWHSFWESMEACVASVVNVYKMLGVATLIALLYSVPFGRTFLFLVVLLTLSSFYLAFYLAMIFVVAVLVSCAAGALLYGLVWVMRYAGQLGRSETHGKEEPPRALRMVV